MKFFKHIRDALIWLAAAVAIQLIGSLPRKAVRSIAYFIGSIMYRMPCFGPLCVMNVKAAFPEKDMDWVCGTARRSLQNLTLTICEFFWIRKRPGRFNSLVNTDEADECAAACREAARDSGAIMVTPHIGNWEFAGRTLAEIYGFRMATIVRAVRNPMLDRLVNSGRTVGKVNIIYSKGAAQGMKMALAEHWIVGILIDQNTKVREGGVFVNFFGLPIPVSRAPAVLARKTNCFTAVGTTLRNPDGSFRGILRKMSKRPSEYRDDTEFIQELTSISEELIRLAPDQYLWMYKRFQYIPKDIPDAVRTRFPPYAVEPSESFYSNVARKNKKH